MGGWVGGWGVLNRTGGSFRRQLSLLQAFRNWKFAQNGKQRKKMD